MGPIYRTRSVGAYGFSECVYTISVDMAWASWRVEATKVLVVYIWRASILFGVLIAIDVYASRTNERTKKRTTTKSTTTLTTTVTLYTSIHERMNQRKKNLETILFFIFRAFPLSLSFSLDSAV